MTDEAWIDELERRAMPLRVALPPWGEVLAREALRAPLREPAPRPRRWVIAAIAGAAAAGAAWVWPRHEPAAQRPTVLVREQMTAPPVVTRPPAAITPTPAPVEDPLASTSHQPAEPTPRPRARRRDRSPPPRVELVENDAPSVDCILDPSRCHPAKSAAPTDDLPETIGTAEVKRGIDGIKPQVHDCARVHGAISKQKVTIKLTISGESGKVTQANIVSPKLAVDLEQCIVAAVRRGSFARFRKERLGVMFPLTMP